MPPAPRRLSLAELDLALAELWRAVVSASTAPRTVWRAAYTPPLPSDWPPALATLWVRYGFAYGQALDLVDGLRVARPWARIEALGDQAQLIPLRAALEPCGVQGVRPLSEAERAVLHTGAEEERNAGGLAGPPAAHSFRAYYRQWLLVNGAVAPALPVEHAAFFDWLRKPEGD